MAMKSQNANYKVLQDQNLGALEKMVGKYMDMGFGLVPGGFSVIIEKKRCNGSNGPIHSYYEVQVYCREIVRYE